MSRYILLAPHNAIRYVCKFYLLPHKIGGVSRIGIAYVQQRFVDSWLCYWTDEQYTTKRQYKQFKKLKKNWLTKRENEEIMYGERND